MKKQENIYEARVIQWIETSKIKFQQISVHKIKILINTGFNEILDGNKVLNPAPDILNPWNIMQKSALGENWSEIDLT